MFVKLSRAHMIKLSKNWTLNILSLIWIMFRIFEKKATDQGTQESRRLPYHSQKSMVMMWEMVLWPLLQGNRMDQLERIHWPEIWPDQLVHPGSRKV